MNLYTSLTLRYLKENKKRTIVTIIGIILSTALICGIGNIYESLMDYQRRETINRKGDFYSTISNVKVENIDYITKASGVKKSGISDSLGYAKLDENLDNVIKVRQYNKGAFEGYQIKLKEGRLPKNNKEIVLSENTINPLDKKYNVGDKVTLNIGDRLTSDDIPFDSQSMTEGEKIVNTKASIYEIVGIMYQPGFEYKSKVSNAITYLNLSEVHDNTVNISIKTGNPKDIYDLVPAVAKNAKIDIKIVEGTEDYSMPEYENISYNEHLLRVEGASKYSTINSTISGAIILVTSLVVLCTIATVYNSFSISVSERKKQFGILNSIGATNIQIIKMVLIEGLIISIISIPIGLLCGTVAMDIVFKSINGLFENSMISEMNLRVVFSPSIMILSTIVVLITIFISAILPAISAARTSPLDAIRNSSNVKIGKVKNSRLIKKIFKTEGVLAYKNLRRNKKKYRITLFSLIISVVIFVSFSGFIKIMMKAESIRVGQMTYDVYISSTGDESEKDVPKIKNAIDKITGVTNYTLQDGYGLSMEIYLKENMVNKEAKEYIENSIPKENQNNEYIYKTINNSIKLPGDKAIDNLKLKEGYFSKEEAIKENGVVIVNKNSYEGEGKKAEYNLTNYKVGDIIEGKTIYYDSQKGEEIIKSVKLKVMAISDDLLPGEFGYRNGGINIITYDEVGKNIEALADKDTFYICTDEKPETKESLRKLAEKYYFNFTDEAEESKFMRDSYKTMQVFVYGFISVISLVSVTNIVNTISTNINLRKRELAIIQSIGVTPQGFNKMIYLESFLYGALSLIYGIPLGLVPIIIMNKIIGMTIYFRLELPWEAIGIAVIGIFVITFIASYIPMKKLNKENIIENIRSESI